MRNRATRRGDSSVMDAPGTIARDTYPFGHAGKAVMILRFHNIDTAIVALQEAGVSMVESMELYTPVEDR